MPGSSKAVDKAVVECLGRWGGASSDRGFRGGVELGGGDPGGLVDLARVGGGVAGQRCPAEGPPPVLLQVRPAGGERGEGVSGPGMVFQSGWVGRLGGSSGRVRRCGSSCCSLVAGCRARRLLIFWSELRVVVRRSGVGARPADPFSQQDPLHLAVAHLDIGLAGGFGRGIQGPLRRPVVVGGGVAGTRSWRIFFSSAGSWGARAHKNLGITCSLVKAR